MSFQFRPGVREEVALLFGLIGTSGSGKTFTAMRLAKGICGDKPFAVIDTEAGRAKHYADLFRFDHGDLKPPFRPESYADAIKAADEAGYKAIIVDSCSHEWAGESGILEWQEEELTAMVKRAMEKRENAKEWDLRETFKMSSWIKPKQAHKRMIQRLLQVRANIILCFRAEEKMEMLNPFREAMTAWDRRLSSPGWESVDPSGKPIPSKELPDKMISRSKGYQPICSKEMPYELTVSFLLTPDKPGIPQPIKFQEQHRKFFPLDKQISEESGRLISEWAAGGTKKEEKKEEKKSPIPPPLGSKFEEIINKEKDRVGWDAYLRLLGDFGFEDVSEISDRKIQEKFYVAIHKLPNEVTK